MSIWVNQRELERHFDAAVVGGGPAGCAAAYALARHGIKVVVFERGSPGRDKACGDMFVPAAVEELRRLGLAEQDLVEVGGAPFDAVELLGSRGLLWRIRYPNEPVWILPRRSIDQKLRDGLSGMAEIVYQGAVEGIVAEVETSALPRFSAKGNWRLVGRIAAAGRLVPGARSGLEPAGQEWKFSLRCQAVVIPSGAQSNLARTWGISGRPHLMPAISAYAQGSGFSAPAFEFAPGCRPGYCWLFPIGSSSAPCGRDERGALAAANVGVCALEPIKGLELRARGQKLLARHRLGGAVRWRGGAGALWSGCGQRWHHPAGLVACGDAAGLIDPLSGEGLTAALRSGQAAGEAVANFLRDKLNPKWLEDYSAYVAETFSARYGRTGLRAAWKQLCGLLDPP